MGLAGQPGTPYARAADSARGCGYYLRYLFLFASLVQTLIIVGLVLFMVYGNVHQGTEANLRDAERRTAELHGQLQGLKGLQANLTRQLNLTARDRDSNAQVLNGVRRDLDRINSSFRQCQAEMVTCSNYQQFFVAIILSEHQCQEQMRALNKSCQDRFSTLGGQILALEKELSKERLERQQEQKACADGRGGLQAQLQESERAREQQAQLVRLAQEQLRKAQELCAPLDRSRLHDELLRLWRDAVVTRSLDSLSYGPNYGLFHDVSSVRRACDQLPGIMETKAEELAQRLRAGVDEVVRENAKLQGRNLELQRDVSAEQAKVQQAKREAAQLEATLRGECARQVQQVQEEKAALRTERDHLARQLADLGLQVKQLQLQVDVKSGALDTCLKAKSPPVTPPRLVVPNPQPAIDKATLEEFKRRILEAQRPPGLVPASG